MRKLILCAAAAMVALASCSKTQVINTEPPQEIAFKAVAGAITKTSDDPLSEDIQMGVFAYVHNGTSLEAYFGNTSFSKDGEYWTAGKYWPVNHSLDFVVYAPYFDGNTYSFSNTSGNVLTITADNTTTETDYLYGNEYYDGQNNTGYNKTDESIPVQLNHAMAKVTVNFTVEKVKITDVTLPASVRKGTCTVTYGDSTVVKWTSTDNDKDANGYKLIETIEALSTATDQVTSPVTASVLLVPETTSDITFNYQIEGSDATLPYTIEQIDDFKWEHGKHYIYNVKVTPKEIKFTPTVLKWTDIENEGKPETNL